MSALATVIRHEGRLLSADRSTWIGLTLFLLLMLYAALSGAAWVQTRQAEAAVSVQQSAERSAEFGRNLALIEAGRLAELRKPSWYPSWSAAPTTPDSRAVLPSKPLLLIASNAGELQPQIATMRAASSRHALFDDLKASTQNPMTLAIGRLDAAFLLTAVLPLLMLAFSFNLLSAEREQGTLALVLAQPIGLATLLAGKLLTRFVRLLLPIAIGVPLLLAVVLDPAQLAAAPLDYLWLALLILIYGAFWLLLAGIINAFGGSSARNALSIGGLWLLLVLVIPSLLNVAAAALHPPPDRAGLTNELRARLVEARNDGGKLFEDHALEHPDTPIAVSTDKAEAFDSARATLTTWLVRERTDALVAPIAERFERELAAQQALAEAGRFLSPALLFQAALNRLAGVEAARSRAFSDAAKAHLDALRALLIPKVLAGEKLRSGDYAALPVFAMPEPSAARPLLIDLLALLLGTSAVAVLLTVRLRGSRPSIR